METSPSPSPSPSPSLTFTRITDESAFTRRHRHLHTTTVHHLTPPEPLSSDRPWIFTSSSATPAVFLHPLTSKPHSFNFPHNLDVSQFDRSTLSVSYHLPRPHHVDKLLVCHGSRHLSQPDPFQLNNNLTECTMLALYAGGELRACPRVEKNDDVSPWVKLSQPGVKFNDMVFYKGVIYVVGRQKRITSVVVHPSTRKISIARIIGSSERFGWRKRFVVDGENLYLVVRVEEEVFKVYKRKKRVMCREEIAWDVVKRFEGDKVLFVSKDHYFFQNAFKKFPGREYKNCIVFSEAAFPQYGLDCWEFSQSDDRQFSEDDIAIFRLNDGTFARDGENSCFPRIDWSPPAWVFNADEFRTIVAPEYHSQSERGPDKDDGLNSASRDKNDGWLPSNLKEEQEEMEYAFSNKDPDQKGMDSGSGSQDQEDGKMQCDSNCQDEDSKANIEGNASSKEEGTTEVMAVSLSTGEEEVGRTLISVNCGSDAIQEANDCHSQSEREPDEDEDWKSAGREKNDGGMQSDLTDLDSRVKEEQEELEYSGADEDGGLKSSGRDKNDGGMQVDLKDLDSRVKEEQEEMEYAGADEDGGLKSAGKDKNDGGMQVDLKDLDSRVKEEQEEMEYAFSNEDQDQKGMASGSDSQGQEDGKMQCDWNCRDKYMHYKAKDEEGTTEVMALSLTNGEEEVGRTFLSMSSGSDEIEEGTSGKNIIHSIPKPSTSCTTQSDKSDSSTTEFEGFYVRSDLVLTLKKIWVKYGNIIKDTIVHNSNIIATSLEALAIMVQILEDNSAQSFSDSLADFLSSTLSDLKCIRFEVDWLVYFVEKALNIHKSKSLGESLNNLRLLSSQANERRATLLDELTKLDVEEGKRKKEMEKLSKVISFYGQAMFDEPVGAGLT